VGGRCGMWSREERSYDARARGPVPEPRLQLDEEHVGVGVADGLAARCPGR
jgi:hypothetical protein